MVVGIDKYGIIVNDNPSYRVTLSEGYRWNFLARLWEYDVETINPTLKLSKIYTDNLIF